MSQEHKSPTLKLGLDEALIQVNTRDFQIFPELAAWSLGPTANLQLLYQIEECFRCPLKKLNASKSDESQGEFKLSSFKLSTKHALSHLELRKTRPFSRNICKLTPPITLQNNAEYALTLNEDSSANSTTPPTTTTDSVLCKLTRVRDGPCDYCWLAGAFGLIFAISLLEVLWVRLVGRGRHRRRSLVYDSSVQTAQPAKTDDPQMETELKQVGVPSEPDDPDLATTPQMNNIRDGTHDHDIDDDKMTEVNKRLDCLDAFRGMTITGMIMVNYGGAGYSKVLDHAPWDGLTPADLVFPFFIFSMGASIGISIRSLLRGRQLGLRRVILRVFKRSMMLMLIGVSLNSMALSQPTSWQGMRLPGVLQRFALSYSLVALCYTLEMSLGGWIREKSRFWGQRVLRLATGRMLELVLAGLCTATYIFFTLFFIYDPQCPLGYTGPGGQTLSGPYANCTGGAAGWIDRKLLGENHLWRNRDLEEIFGTTLRHDPEGILGYTTSVLLTLAGLSCGLVLIDKRSNARGKLTSLLKWFVFMLALCYGIIIWIPINKSLLSITFVGVSGACAILTISLLYVIVDLCQCHRFFLLKLWLAAGKNSLILYIGHSLIHKMLPWWFPVNEDLHSALLLQLLWSTFVWLLFAKWLDNKKLYIKL